MNEIALELWYSHKDFVLGLGRRALTAVLIIIVGRIAVLVMGKLVGTGKLKVDETLTSVLRCIIRYGIVIVCAIMILDVFGFNTNSLIALLGAAGVAVGLALKDTLSNIAAGIFLLFLRPFRQGDFIEFGSFMGTVREINLFATILETGDGIYISAPNASLWGVPMKNYTRNNRRRMDLSVMIAYSDSIDTAFGVLKEIAAGEKRFLPNPPPQIMVQSMADSGVSIMLRAWTHADVYWSVYWDQMRNIKENIEAAGLTIPFPQRDIRIVRTTDATGS
ncbi:MAG: mechanosensitive ion channel family protein [Treponema sp.]|nr:mechanosensitive ion channel family protein [Treponema sp.]